MIIETKLEDGLIERRSDRGVYIKNNVTGNECILAFDIPNEERIKRGLTPYTYSETERVVETYYMI